MRTKFAALAAMLLIASALAPAVFAAEEMDAKITAKLVQALGDDAKGIKVTFFDGKAILLGNVTERSTQELAEEVAYYFPEVKKVDNEIKAAKANSVTGTKLRDESLDAALESSVKGALANEIGTHAKDIELEACDGAVSLRGTVPDEARYKLALEAAKKAKGVTKVVDLLRIKP